MSEALAKAGMRRAAGNSRFVMNPEHNENLQKWDRLTMAALAYVAIVSPVQISMLEVKLDVWFGINCAIDLIFLIDMILQFFIMYPETASHGILWESRKNMIAKNYLRTWFKIDVLSIIPFDVINLFFRNADLQHVKIVKILRLLRLMKLLRTMRASRLLHRFEIHMSITYRQLALIQFFIMLLVITHWLANLWALSLELVDEDAGLPRWVDAFDEMEANVEDKTKDTAWKLYISSVYFTSYTLTSVGYGDIGPQNIVERIVCTIMIVISGMSWAIVLGQVCGIMASMNMDEQAFRTTMDELNIMFRCRAFPPPIRQRVRGFLISSKTARRNQRHRAILSSLSPGLRGEVALQVNRPWMEKISFFKSWINMPDSSSCIHEYPTIIVETCLEMQLDVYAQREQFGKPQMLYILNRGLVSHRGRLLRQGAVWGTDFLLCDLQLIESTQAFALTYVELASLQRQAFLDLLEKHRGTHPELAEQVRRCTCWLALQRALLAEAHRRSQHGNKASPKRRKLRGGQLPIPCVRGAVGEDLAEELGMLDVPAERKVEIFS